MKEIIKEFKKELERKTPDTTIHQKGLEWILKEIINELIELREAIEKEEK